MAQPRSAFDVVLSDDARQQLAQFACDAISEGLSARGQQAQQVDYWWRLYDQERTRGRMPWADAADLTSYLAVEKADALHARLMRTVFGAEPVWTVEGWGEAATKAPLVEEFHQWKLEEERLQGEIDRLVLQALVEPRGLLEIAEGSELRTVRKTIVGQIKVHPETGGPWFDEQGGPIFETNSRGEIVEATDPTLPAAETVIDSTERVRTGPVYRILPYGDSLILPAHARDKSDIYGYFKRFWKRHDQLRAQADGGVYDAAVVESLHGMSDRESTDALDRANVSVTTKEHGRAEIELWEGVLLIDLASLFESNGIAIPRKARKALTGERWYLVTVHVPTQQVLRVQFDDLERSRFVPVILFPRVDRVTEGYSLIGHKLITVIEEHTAVRNMKADRTSLANRAPIKRMQGALWDPAEQPFGPGSVIDVRDMRELEPMVIPDVTPAMAAWEQIPERAAERIAGINDVASGQVATESRTLGEVQMATEQSFVRMDLVTKRFQEAMEDIAQIRHAIWTRVLAERGDDGMDAPVSLVNNLEGRGVSIDAALPDSRITASMLEGVFRFKPHGSVENADPNRRRNDMMGMLQALPMVAKAFPMIGPFFNTPTAARAFLREFLRNFGVKNTQAFLGSVSQDMAAQGILAQQPPPPVLPPPVPPGLPQGSQMGPLPSLPGGMPNGMPPAADAKRDNLLRLIRPGAADSPDSARSD